MTEYVALLRAVNVGGHAPLAMPALREAVARWGARNIRTVLQSGNMVFESKRRPERELEGELARSCETALHQRIEFFVRDSAAWRQLVSENPFPDEAATDPAHLHVLFLKEDPVPDAWKRLREAIRGPERFAERPRLAYILYPDGMGRSTLTPAVIERSLGSRGTDRNWNTVLRLHGLLAPDRA
jgi:uncharacterized protein (DUF1697 family)